MTFLNIWALNNCVFKIRKNQTVMKQAVFALPDSRLVLLPRCEHVAVYPGTI
uniref:Uncharacterized protein n=1 Tax=Anguilla anguilla TaxID=7936 RepID=A0A0E9PY39_ANGAN